MTPEQLQTIREQLSQAKNPFFFNLPFEFLENVVPVLLAEVERLEKQLATVGELAVDAFIVQNADKFTWLTLDDIERRRVHMEKKP